jgi:Protein of unknown function (DUF1194)
LTRSLGSGFGEALMQAVVGWFHRGFLGLLFVLTLGSCAVQAQPKQEVDLLLVLAADVSRSIDEAKFKLQRDGYASALTDPAIVRAMQGVGTHKRIGIIFIEWAGAGETRVIVDWTSIGSLDDARAFADKLLATPRPFYGRTSIAGAIEIGMAQLALSPFKADRRIIDISGDGTNNAGREVTEARDAAAAAGITVNGVVILSAVPLPFNPAHTHPPGGLLAYYQNNVIGGPGGFALAAESFETFGQAMRAKLIKEIASAGQMPPG